ncbi:MAG: hypothetical protein ABMA26_13835 [Limisphaerales bacterium]
MKATSALLVTTLAAAVFIGCDKKEPAAPKADAPKTESPKSGTDTKAAAKPYTLDVCIVSGEKLGSMGAPVVHVHEGQEVKLCCKSCLPDFKKEPAKFLAKLAAKK